jgi:tetratricopeptide (TPR) repeat protein
VQSLQAPGKARSEYQRACEALRSQKLSDSEQHLRKALKIYPADPQGWVFLGKLLAMSNRLEEAADACSQAVSHDASSWTGDLCLAEVNGREKRWTQSLAESNTAVSLHPESKLFADYFSAVALFNLRELPQAEVRAREAEQMDRNHALPPLQYLVAEIDEAKGDTPAAITQLREYLKYATDPDESDRAKKDLERLETQAK